MTIAHERALAARLLCVGFAGAAIDDDLREMLGAGVAGVVLFARNASTRAGCRELSAAIKREAARLGNPGVFAAIDHEGGRVVRLSDGMTRVPPMREIGAKGEAEAARIGALFAQELRSAGIDLDFAPVVDVDSNPANPIIGDRSFGAEAATVCACGGAFIRAMQGGGVAACAKHFPGHGDTELDSHLHLPRLAHTVERLREVELPPFASAVAAGVASIMTAHVVFDALDGGTPATMSRKLIDGILRKELRYEGVVFSDDLEMAAIADWMGIGEAAVRSVAAGVDCLLVCHRADRQREAIEALTKGLCDRTLPHERVEQAAVRLDLLRARYAR
jgi:beta-N-acetylhexosaminidase